MERCLLILELPEKKTNLLIYLSSPIKKNKGNFHFVLKYLKVGIWDGINTLFMFKLFISFSLPVRDTVLKEKLKLHFLRTVFMLGWFWNLDIASKYPSPFLSVWQSIFRMFLQFQNHRQIVCIFQKEIYFQNYLIY